MRVVADARDQAGLRARGARSRTRCWPTSRRGTWRSSSRPRAARRSAARRNRRRSGRGRRRRAGGRRRRKWCYAWRDGVCFKLRGRNGGVPQHATGRAWNAYSAALTNEMQIPRTGNSSSPRRRGPASLRTRRAGRCDLPRHRGNDAGAESMGVHFGVALVREPESLRTQCIDLRRRESPVAQRSAALRAALGGRTAYGRRRSRQSRRRGGLRDAPDLRHDRRATTLCGCRAASENVSTGAKHASEPSNTRTHSSRVLVRNTCANRSRSTGHPARSCCAGSASSASPRRCSSSS